MSTRFLAVVTGLVFCLLFPAAVQAQYNYTTNNSAITITGYTGAGGAVTIPSMINGLPVTSIGFFAFFNNTNLTSVTVPNSVISIGLGAFEQCTTLTSVTIPASVINIQNSAFGLCTSLSAINIDTNNAFYSSVAGVFFNKNLTTLIQCPGGKIGSYEIPSSVSRIGDNAFGFCTNLTNVTIPNSVINIGVQAFSHTSLTNITIPSGVTGIGDGAFQVSTSLANVTILASLTSIGNGMFFYCPSLTSVTIPNSVTRIGDQAFLSCSSLTNVTISTNVTSIGYNAFLGCSSLTSVTLPHSVTSLGDSAFWGCSSLTRVYFQGNAPSVTNDVSVFSGDYYATACYLPETTGWGSSFDGIPVCLCQDVAVTVTQNPPQGGTTVGNGTYRSCMNVTVTATPSACYQFMNWTDDDMVVSTSTSYSFTVRGNRALVANFTLIPYTITTSASPVAGGTTSGGGIVDCGSTIVVVAAANPPYQFLRWTENGSAVSTNSIYTLPATANRNLVALFGQVPVITATPVITNALLVAGNRVVIAAGETNFFSIGATDLDGYQLSYRWVFGDGVTNAWDMSSEATHAYTASNCGPASASVMVSDGKLTVSSNLTVIAVCDLTVSKLQLGLNFAKANVDSINLIVKLDLPGITNVSQLTGVQVIVDVAGAQVPFTLDNKGRGVSPNGTCVLTYTKPTKKLAGHWTVTITLSKGNWHLQWLNYGLDNATHKSPGVSVTLPVVVLIGNEAFAAEPTLHYTATFGKTGTAK